MIAVLHLVWGPLGPAPLHSFLASYRAHQSGAEHDLLIVLNGVTDQCRPALLAELDGVDHSLIELERPVQDLVAYAQAAEQVKHQQLCFLNSYSVILAPNWLAMLKHALDGSGAGLVGATGSWASLRSLMLHSLSLPSPYRDVIPDRHATFEQLGAIRADLDGDGPAAPAEVKGRAPSRPKALLRIARSLPSMVEQVRHFESFPDHHLRTNAFMVQRTVFARLRLGGIGRKMEAYRLESGHESFTRQVEALGLRALVVDRHGGAHEHPDWSATSTFWQRDQDGLLVADNQTRIYAEGSPDRRRLLSGLAWGAQADPSSSLPIGAIG